MNIRPLPHRKNAVPPTKKKAPQDNPRKAELARGVSNLLLANTEKRASLASPADELPRIRAAQNALKELKSSDYTGMMQELDQARTKAAKQWTLSMLMPVGVIAGFLTVVGALPAVAGLSGAAALGTAGVSALLKSNKSLDKANDGMKGLEDAKNWIDREGIPAPIPREDAERELQTDLARRVSEGNLSEVWKLGTLDSIVDQTEGNTSLELLTNMGKKDQLKAVKWMRFRPGASESPQPRVPGETPLTEVTRKVEQSISRNLADDNFLAAKKSLDTLSLLEKSGAETWSEFVEGIVDKHDRAFRGSQGEFGVLFGTSRVEHLQNLLDDALIAASAPDTPTVDRVKSRAEVAHMLDEANDTRFLNDYPKENRARRLFQKLPGADLYEMIYTGPKDRKRAQALLQALHDSQLDWIFGTD